MMTTFIRLVLTALLLYGVFKETGPVTTLVLALFAINNEIVWRYTNLAETIRVLKDLY